MADVATDLEQHGLEEVCDVCGRPPAADLVSSETAHEFLCEECWAEEESCGCTDD